MTCFNSKITPKNGMDTSGLEPSKLGTKEQFGKKATNEMVKWVNQHAPPRPDVSVLKVGSGNGALLFALVEGRVIQHIDSRDSEGAVQLVQEVAHSRNLTAITFRVCDFLHEESGPTIARRFRKLTRMELGIVSLIKAHTMPSR
ncbi:hypothetical protein DFJ58DRAFT_916412 [Suillus subalutaceus]|uniref:uncharacterized protein n=1 Tax=Suillus subalutaceus TaxID=48586 RepID=UPI001B86981F|nr:uncharacterized protein DFJ58DRAFT_916412 [Suillus subalutaceus]KAG1841681.1 hypothetical protein DFJ58DRAFT_916412 [Suillus subalutaceus]